MGDVVGGIRSHMAGVWDHFCKRLVGQRPEQYVKWVEEHAQFVRERNVELKIKHRFTDALLEVRLGGREGLFHFEFQVAKGDDIEERVLEYNVMASRQYELPVSSYLVYLRKHEKLPRSPYVKRFVDDKTTHRFYYQVIKLWEFPAEQLLALGWEGLLPLVPLAKGGKKPELIQVMVDTLAKQEEWELLSSAHMLGGLVFEKPKEKEWFERRFEMYQNILEETWVYQSIGEKFSEKAHKEGREQGLQEGIQQGIQQGVLQGMRQVLVEAVQRYFPEIEALVKSQAELIQDQKVLTELTLGVVAAQTSEEFLQLLTNISTCAPTR